MMLALQREVRDDGARGGGGASGGGGAGGAIGAAPALHPDDDAEAERLLMELDAASKVPPSSFLLYFSPFLRDGSSSWCWARPPLAPLVLGPPHLAP